MKILGLLCILFCFYTIPSLAINLNLDESFCFKDTMFLGNKIIGIERVHVLSDNTLLASISVSSSIPYDRLCYLVKLLANGEIDNNFFYQKIVGSGAFDLQSDNRIITVIPSNNSFTIVRLHENGTIDNSFSYYYLGCKYTSDIKVLGDNTILVGVSGSLLKLSENGTNTSRLAYYGEGFYHSPQITFGKSDNEDIYYTVNGEETIYGPGHRTYTRTYKSIERMDKDFNISRVRNAHPSEGTPKALVHGSRLFLFGNIVQLRKVSAVYNDYMYGIFCFFNNPDGAVCDTLFNIPTLTQKGFDGIPYDAIPYNGKIVLVGGFKHYNGFPVNSIVRIEKNGDLDRTFNPGIGPDGYIQNICEGLDNSIFVWGDFKTYNGVPRRYIAKLNGDKQRFQYEWFNNLTIRPNPANDICTIDNIPIGYSVRITDVVGSTIITFPPAHQTSTKLIDTKEMSSGMYFIYIQDTDGHIITKPLVVEH